jgi:hypothetical protein
MPCFSSGHYLRSQRNLRLKMFCSFALIAVKPRWDEYPIRMKLVRGRCPLSSAL